MRWRRTFRIGLVTASAYAFLGAGTLLQTSPWPEYLGRYSSGDVQLLLALVLSYVPVVLLLSFCLGDDSLRLPRGWTLDPGPRTRLAALAGGAVLALAAGEAHLRSTPPPPLPAPSAAGLLEGYFRFHPFLQIATALDHPGLHTNRHGFRGEPITREKPPGTWRAFVLGGSTVLCMRNSWEASHPRLLELALRARYPDRAIEVQNAGCDWWTSQHSLHDYLFRVREFRPDLVVMWHGINDLARSFTPYPLYRAEFDPDYSHYLGPTVGMWQDRARPRLGQVVRLWGEVEERAQRLYSDLRPPPAPPPLRRIEVERFESLEPFRRNLTLTCRQLRADGVALVLATQPTIYRDDLAEGEQQRLMFPDPLCRVGDAVPSLASMKRGMEAMNLVTRQVAAAEGVPLLDLDALVPRDLEHFADDCHFTDRGNEVVARAVEEFLVQEGHPH